MTGNRRKFLVVVAGACLLWPYVVTSQGLTGTLIGTVKDEQGGVLPAALVRVIDNQQRGDDQRA